MVVLAGTIFGKPQDREEAFTILKRLQGRTHQVMTGFAVVSRQQAIEVIDTQTTQVAFDRFDDVVLRAYVDSGEPMDKAGAYGIQDRGAFLVRSITGSYSNVVGLPLNAVVQTLLRCGLAAPA